MKVINALALCLVILFVATDSSHAASVTLKSPKAGEAWKLGETKNIEWNYSGPEPGAQKWKLVLKKGAADVGTIANKVSGSRYSWSVGQYTGGNATPGADYTIQVLNVASSKIKSSSGAFSISIPRITQKMEGPKQPQPIGPAPKTTPPATATPKTTPPAKAGPKWEPNFSVVGYPKIMRIEGLAIPSRELIIKGNEFGTTRGEVRLYGQFMGGQIGLEIDAWNDNSITAIIPKIRASEVHQARLRVERPGTHP